MKMVKRDRILKALFLVLLAAVVLFVLDEAAFATTTSDKLPWEKGLETLSGSLTGPVAGIISLIAIVGAGAMLLFGGNIQGFMRTMVYIILVIGIVVGASSLLKTFYSNASVNIPCIPRADVSHD